MKKSKILMLLALTSATYMQQASVSRMGRSAASVARPIAMRGLGSSGQYIAPTAVASAGAFSPGGVQSRNYLTESYFSKQDEKIKELRAEIDVKYDILAEEHEDVTEAEKELEIRVKSRRENRNLINNYDVAYKDLLEAHTSVGKYNSSFFTESTPVTTIHKNTPGPAEKRADHEADVRRASENLKDTMRLAYPEATTTELVKGMNRELPSSGLFGLFQPKNNNIPFKLKQYKEAQGDIDKLLESEQKKEAADNIDESFEENQENLTDAGDESITHKPKKPGRSHKQKEGGYFGRLEKDEATTSGNLKVTPFTRGSIGKDGSFVPGYSRPVPGILGTDEDGNQFELEIDVNGHPIIIDENGNALKTDARGNVIESALDVNRNVIEID